MRVHVIQTGSNVASETILRRGCMASPSSFLRPRRWFEFPVYSYVLEHPEGLIAIDTGHTVRAKSTLEPRPVRWLTSIPTPVVERGDEIDVQMRAEGLRPEDVGRVVLTHLDRDHAIGMEHFRGAEILVHRPELEFATSRFGRLRCQPQLWPSWFEPALYELDPEPYGPFPRSKVLTERGDVRLVPLPGHTPGQVGVVVETEGPSLLFCADHVLRQDWFAEDAAAGELHGLAFFPKLAPQTSRAILRFVEETPTVLLPAHDSDAPRRLATREPAFDARA